MSTDEGDAMEAADARLTQVAAQACHTPADYALFQMAGRQAVELARGMSPEDRSKLVMWLSHNMPDEARMALSPTGRMAAPFDPGQQKPPRGLRR